MGWITPKASPRLNITLATSGSDSRLIKLTCKRRPQYSMPADCDTQGG